MSIKWVKVCDSNGKIHTFDNDLTGHYLEAERFLTESGRVLVVRHKPDRGFSLPKQEVHFFNPSSYQIMRD